MSYSILQQAAKKAIELLQGKAENWIAIATQFVQEKGYHWWENPQPPYNVGNIKVFMNGNLVFGEFSSLEAGVEAYAHFLLNDPAGYYADVVRQIRMGDPESVLVALSKSKFCDPPYPLYELTSILGHLESVFGVSNSAQAHPAQAPAQPSQPNGAEYVTVTPWPSPHSSLWGIAADVYHDGNQWRHLLTLNPGLNPAHLQAGQKIRVR